MGHVELLLLSHPYLGTRLPQLPSGNSSVFLREHQTDPCDCGSWVLPRPPCWSLGLSRACSVSRVWDEPLAWVCPTVLVLVTGV